MVVHIKLLYLVVAIYAHFTIQNNYFVSCSVLDKFGNLNDVKILPKKYVIDVTQEKARSNTIHVAHNIPIDGTFNIVQSKSSRSRVSIALNAARGCKVRVEINEADDCSLEINLNGGQRNEVDVVMNNARNSKLVLT